MHRIFSSYLYINKPNPLRFGRSIIMLKKNISTYYGYKLLTIEQIEIVIKTLETKI